MRLLALALLAGMALAACGSDGTTAAMQNPPEAAPPAGRPAPAPPLAFQFGPGQTWQVKQVTCRQLLEAPPRDRDAATIFYYGYLAGRTRLDVVETSKMDAELRRVIDQCARNPSLNVAQAFQQTLTTQPRWIWEMP
jgi:hypothetical protein